MSRRWFHETLFTDFEQRFRIERVLYEGRTECQDILIFQSARFGRVLALDGIIQTTEADEFCYHEMITHVPIIAHGAARVVAVIGGGDGGGLREILRHKSVEQATMVEIDGEVVVRCREYLPGLSDGAFDDPRTELVIGDGRAFMAKTDTQFDVIIVDSTDPGGPSMPLFGEEFYADCKRHLTEGGILVTQSGVSFMQDDEARATHARLAGLFTDAHFYLAQVPSYGAGFMTLGWGCDNPAARAVPLDTLHSRVSAAGLTTRYYTPEIHQAAFALPGYIAALKS